MSAAPPGWERHEITDGSRYGIVFEVLTRRRARAAASGGSGTPAAASQPRAIGSQNLVAGCDTSELSHNSDPSETTVSPGQEANGRARSERPMGSPALRPCDRAAATGSSSPASPASGAVGAGVSVPATAFGDLPSVKAMGTGRAGIVVGFDTEFTTVDGARIIDSYQFAVPDPLDPSVMVEVVILPPLGSGARISLHTALWTVVVAAELWQSPLVPDEVGPRGVARGAFWSDDWVERREALAKLRVPIVLACHYGSADLTTFRTGGHARELDALVRLTSAAGGLVTLLPFRSQRGNENGHWWQSLSVTVRDTMSQTPAGKKSLAVLGEACGVPKLDVPEGWISRMTDYRREHLLEFLEYGVNDAVIVLGTLTRQWGDGVVPPITLSGGAAAALVDSGSAYLGASSPSEFRRKFAGLVDEDEGVEAVEEGDRLSYYAKRGRNPLDGAAAQLSSAFARAYHGGLNSCPMPGFYPLPTVDIDAQNAYPTAMALVRDLDWEAGAIGEVVHERSLTINDVPTATTPFVGFVSFTFPAEVTHPCLPIVADGTLVYPRTSEGVAGTWVCGPELWLTLGAEVHCQIGYLGRELRQDGEPSLSLRHGVKHLIDDRNAAKALFGKGSLEEQTLKTGVNSIYGKTAQDVAEQRSWDARAQEMDNVGGSAVSSPYHAAMTTSLVRAQLLATMNQLVERGGHVYSVTTDGFITDFTVDEVAALDLYGLDEVLSESRSALTGDPGIWEAKHAQNDLVNFTTRGNVSLDLGGVCAHNGLKAPKGIVPDSIEDRELLLVSVVTREGRVPNGYTSFPSFQELSRTEDRKDFIPSRVERSVSLDYDLKRKPVMSSMNPEMVPLPDGSTEEMATFTTEPWERVEDCLRARQIAREMAQTGCLRTIAEWRDWDLKYTHGKGRRLVTPQRTVLMSIVMAHRQGVVVIPTLADRSLSIAERLAWLDEWGLGTVSRGDWDNARRPERASQMLPIDVLDPYLARMASMPSGDHPTDADRLPY
ncbi:hypothetical protein [Brevibacterium aurantiacum]|uniref:DNA-directed DNA polymerase n=1 Tax=Brevibacterium aurantiacum TaxID=273384 RepID=A0A2H1K0B8_BREAU|nr:hypothetical protein [Brevibacterium aurantiacum]GEB21966.1 hypothetical protein BAU01nite_06990 [Brevibacterium aurantiacum]SMX93196.1 hypothetical protein BAUR9175_02993 [Brevibacterium aurantiacum]